MKKYKPVLSAAGAVILILMGTLTTKAQVSQQTRQSLLYEVSKIQLAYKKPAYLSFDIKSTMAQEAAPGVILDSSAGSYKLSGSSYWGIEDSIEMMQNDSFMVTVIKPSKVMTVGIPSYVNPGTINFSWVDSIIGKNNYSISITAPGGPTKAIQYTFNVTGFAYKWYKVTYDTVSHYVKEIKYAINDEFEETQDVINEPPVTVDGSTGFRIITQTYLNYSTATFNKASIFNSANYFTIVGESTYTPQAPYGTYEVFLTSPNLPKNTNFN